MEYILVSVSWVEGVVFASTLQPYAHRTLGIDIRVSSKFVVTIFYSFLVTDLHASLIYLRHWYVGPLIDVLSNHHRQSAIDPCEN